MNIVQLSRQEKPFKSYSIYPTFSGWLFISYWPYNGCWFGGTDVHIELSIKDGMENTAIGVGLQYYLQYTF